jgi:23S rRNA (uracil1939-C5)-methyltransferase
VNIVTASDDPGSIGPLAELLSSRYPGISGIVNNITARKAGVAVGESEIPYSGQSQLVDRIGKFDFVISANSFFQTNTRGAERLYETVERYAGLTGTETVVDLYSGTGTIPIFLSGKAGKVTGIEIIESAVADAEINCRRNSVANCRFLRGDIRTRMEDIDQDPDVLIVDPPRAGMHKDIVPRVVALNPVRLVYVSCNPATLARDLALMRESYRVVEVQPVDMFPHTYHIEAVARLVRK